MVPDNRPLMLTLPSDPHLLPVARAFVEAACQAQRLEAAAVQAVGLALHEALSNVIQHAHCNSPGASLQIFCSACSDRVEIRILDEGQPFDLAAVPRLNPAEVRLGGRGVFLMRALMDELTCERRADHGNVLRMVKLCGWKSTPGGGA
jgi:serine/threonine-protein kinase RsbW